MKITETFRPNKIKGSLTSGEKGVTGTIELWDQSGEIDAARFSPPVEQLSPSRRLLWIRSQIIGSNIEFLTPFGRRKILYADHTASGRALTFIEKYILQKVLPVYGNTHTDDSSVGRITSHSVDEASAYVKRSLGGGENDALFFCGTGSTAAIKKFQEIIGVSVPPNLKDQVLSTIDEARRWVVFVGPYEHHSNLLSWRQSLAEVVDIPLCKHGTIDLDKLRSALESPAYANRPKLGSFSACSNVTGIVTDTRAIAKILHVHGCFTCFDFAASAPYVEIDMRPGELDGYDAVFVSPHKFMGGPGTSGILLMSRRLYLRGTGPPTFCGGGTVDFVNFNEKETLYCKDIERREDAGTPGIVQKIRTALTFWVKEFIGLDLISSRETILIENAMTRLSCNPRIQILGERNAKRIAILAFMVHPWVNGGHEELHLTGLTESENANEEEEITCASPLRFLSKGRRKAGLTGLGLNPSENMLEGEELTCASPLRYLSKGERRKRSLKTIKLCGPRSGSDHNMNEIQTPEKEQIAPRGKPLHGRFIITLLNDLFGIQGRGGCSCAGPYGHALLAVSAEFSSGIRTELSRGWGAVKPGWARVSFAYYITEEEFDFLLSAIEFIADYGHKFLQLYNLDWKTGNWTFREEYKEMVAEAEKKIVSKERHHRWSLHRGDVRPSSLFHFNWLSTHPLTKESKSNFVSYMRMAREIADHLQDQSTARDIPEAVDPSLVSFRI